MKTKQISRKSLSIIKLYKIAQLYTSEVLGIGVKTSEHVENAAKRIADFLAYVSLHKSDNL